ncbi:hypothetical protein HNP55_003581 [Paucibacter oligotrophus]|uniref:Uncharacterized protein n=1 Tax=Roseateles oligotrophus TaxID=1769250 RepID=A0A840LDL3_9BURK|nr:hypothetical protein [Roseateles oligotrophus]MBB4845035.1 hypothetical protein [Roseateles oligotrophus]
MSFYPTLAWKSARLAATLAAIDGGGSPGEFWLYSGQWPATPGDVTVEALQVVIVLPNPSGTVSGSTLTLEPNVQGARIGGGQITWGRLVNGAGLVLLDFIAGPGGLVLDSYVGAPGSLVRIKSAVFSE